MKLEKFKKYGKRNKKIICSIIGIVLIICGVLLLKSFAFFESKYDFDVIKGKIPPFNVSDVTLAYTVDGEKISDVFPIKDGKYIATSVTCQNGVTADWDNNLWGLININSNGQKKINCNVGFITPYKEILLNGSYPVLGSDMIPVTIGNGGVVTYADKFSTENVWYSYKNKNWANAVILTNTGKTKNYTAGNTIAEADIESYFVWIPKYAYKIQTLETSSKGQEKPFEIRFGTTNTVDNDTECIAPNIAGENGKCAVGKYMTHPAFTSFGDIKGFWVGKFETTGVMSALTVKPNSDTQKNTNVSTYFKAGYNYKRNLDSHMIKNTEWGATAYLSNSIYGRCVGSTCEEIYINNHATWKTGWSGLSATAGPKSSQGYVYTNAGSVNASSTKNYSGVYDLNGGTGEFVAGDISSIVGTASGFTADDAKFCETKYYDKYTENLRILGDATLETYNWFGDNTGNITSSLPWFVRSGSTYDGGPLQGLFAFWGGPVNGCGGCVFRMVLSPQ